MLRRTLAILTASISLLTGGTAAAASDLDKAFQATFDHPAPVMRSVERPVTGETIRMVTDHVKLDMALTPGRLEKIDATTWALIIKETAIKSAHANPGAIAVAYLHRTGKTWTLDHFWPEVAYNGSFGEPANAGAKIERFGSTTLYFATGEWCGMGECSNGITVIRLDPTGPTYLGDVMGGATFPAIGLPPDPDNDRCEDYAYRVKVGPPATKAGIFSVTYQGWTAPPKKLAPKTRFTLKADAIQVGGSLRLSPKIVVPDCGR